MNIGRESEFVEFKKSTSETKEAMDDVDDSIIRLENNNVASELLETSFCKESKNNEYKLPLE